MNTLYCSGLPSPRSVVCIFPISPASTFWLLTTFVSFLPARPLSLRIPFFSGPIHSLTKAVWVCIPFPEPLCNDCPWLWTKTLSLLHFRSWANIFYGLIQYLIVSLKPFLGTIICFSSLPTISSFSEKTQTALFIAWFFLFIFFSFFILRSSSSHFRSLKSYILPSKRLFYFPKSSIPRLDWWKVSSITKFRFKGYFSPFQTLLPDFFPGTTSLRTDWLAEDHFSAWSPEIDNTPADTIFSARLHFHISGVRPPFQGSASFSYQRFWTHSFDMSLAPESLTPTILLLLTALGSDHYSAGASIL